MGDNETGPAFLARRPGPGGQNTWAAPLAERRGPGSDARDPAANATARPQPGPGKAPTTGARPRHGASRGKSRVTVARHGELPVSRCPGRACMDIDRARCGEVPSLAARQRPWWRLAASGAVKIQRARASADEAGSSPHPVRRSPRAPVARERRGPDRARGHAAPDDATQAAALRRLGIRPARLERRPSVANLAAQDPLARPGIDRAPRPLPHVARESTAPSWRCDSRPGRDRSRGGPRRAAPVRWAPYAWAVARAIRCAGQRSGGRVP